MDQYYSAAAAATAIMPEPFHPQTQPRSVMSLRSRCGRKRFGFYPGEAEVVARMVELRAQGFGFDRIAHKLTEEKAPTRSGKAWHGRVVNRILKGLANPKPTHLVP